MNIFKQISEERQKSKYRLAVEWIAENDEPETLDGDIIMNSLTTLLVADVFDKDCNEVTRDILEIRMNLP